MEMYGQGDMNTQDEAQQRHDPGCTDLADAHHQLGGACKERNNRPGDAPRSITHQVGNVLLQ